MAVLASMEARLDEKAQALERLLARADGAARRPADAGETRRRQAAVLLRRGLGSDEIASALDIPRGEAELMANLESGPGTAPR